MDDKPKNFRPRRVGKQAVEETAPTVTIKLIRIQSLIDAHIYYTGRVSGKSYEWDKAGAIVDVDEQDASELLAKRRGKKPCCGGQERTKIFQLAE